MNTIKIIIIAIDIILFVYVIHIIIKFKAETKLNNTYLKKVIESLKNVKEEQKIMNECLDLTAKQIKDLRNNTCYNARKEISPEIKEITSVEQLFTEIIGIKPPSSFNPKKEASTTLEDRLAAALENEEYGKAAELQKLIEEQKRSK